MSYLSLTQNNYISLHAIIGKGVGEGTSVRFQNVLLNLKKTLRYLSNSGIEAAKIYQRTKQFCDSKQEFLEAIS